MSRVLRARPAGLSGSDISIHSQGTPRQRTRQSSHHTLQRDTRPAPDKDSTGKFAGGTRAHRGEEATKTHLLSGRHSTSAKGRDLSAATRDASKSASERSGTVPNEGEIIRWNGVIGTPIYTRIRPHRANLQSAWKGNDAYTSCLPLALLNDREARHH
jgi:hypothetical protein